eukprot:TRINITY_DN3897_c0_g1_i2.p1 TRINITY_DN3897_c0_g1~~TRINITY_DN3897_c0_g1_i2.p1  ORF type:complete len:388 (-),score=82.81 TRINITY_DN3897_c0_g1_i2:293-1456(-)
MLRFLSSSSPSLGHIFKNNNIYNNKIVGIRKVSKLKHTKLSEYLYTSLKARGPITVASYMRECLTNQEFGYYTTRDPFGEKGDFITAPETTQMFGELIGLWTYQIWKKLKQPKKLRLIECGPGRGTLSFDLLRISKDLPKEFQDSLSLHLLEVSPTLRKIQAETLQCDSNEAQLYFSDIYSPNNQVNDSIRGFNNTPIAWHLDIKEVPGDEPVVLIAQELFDALPIHIIQHEEKNNKWSEVLVDIDDDPNSEYNFKFVLSPGPTIASTTAINNPEVYQKRKLIEPNERVEISLDSISLVTRFGALITKRRGAALIIDYGENHPLSDSLRAIKDHKFENVFKSPGEADLSANVDFSVLSRTITNSFDGLHVGGPVFQSTFLRVCILKY